MIEQSMMLTIPDSVSFKDTRKLYVNTCRTRTVKNKDYLAILGDFMQFIIELVLKNNTVSLPNKCGDVEITGRRIDISTIDIENTNLSTVYKPDWKLTKELWAKNPQAKEEKKLIYLLNENNNQILYKFKWNTFFCDLAHINFYKFTLSRDNKRLMAQVIKDGQEYLLLDKVFKASHKRRKHYEGRINGNI